VGTLAAGTSDTEEGVRSHSYEGSRAVRVTQSRESSVVEVLVPRRKDNTWYVVSTFYTAGTSSCLSPAAIDARFPTTVRVRE
jgi:hypothetical protein